jgi:hypothetical protein
LEESAQPIVTSNRENRKLRGGQLYLDKLGAIRTNLLSILVIAFLPGIIRLTASMVELLYPLRPGGMFLVFICGALAYSWQLGSTASLVVRFLRGERISPTKHISFGFFALPKVLLSHSMLILILFFMYPAASEGTDLTTFLQSMVVVIAFAGFFLCWAPAFVAGEFFTKPVIVDDSDDFEDSESLKSSKPKFFTGMGLLDLGIERSFYFCTINFSLTFTLLLLGLSTKVIPAAVGALIFQRSASYGAITTEVVLSSIAEGILMVAIGLSFIGALPREARSELELLDDATLASANSQIDRTRLIGRFIGFLVIVVTVLCTAILVRVVKNEQSFPAALIPKVYGVESKDSKLTLRFDIDDREHANRWLDAERFRLQVKLSPEQIKANQEAEKPLESGIPDIGNLKPKEGGVLESLQTRLSSEIDKQVIDEPKAQLDLKQYKLLEPKEVFFYSEKGELIDEKFFKPYYGKIKVSLTFDVGSERNEPKLLYMLFDQSAQVIGSFASSASVEEKES